MLAQDSTGKPAAKSDATTIEGCLKQDGSYYNLVDNSGTIIHLSDPSSKLQGHVGHQVAITGMPGVRNIDTTSQGVESTVREQPVFKVKSVKHLAETCTSK
jgi:hypothetical protein